MSNVVQFPVKMRARRGLPVAEPPKAVARGRSVRVKKAVTVLWGIMVLLWPVLRFILPVVVFWKFIKMLWFWNTPGVHAGWTFVAYYAGYMALYYFVGIWHPKGYK